jgi:hypothetical protein
MPGGAYISHFKFKFVLNQASNNRFWRFRFCPDLALWNRSKITFTRRALSGAFRQTRLSIFQYDFREFDKNRSEIITTCLSRLLVNSSYVSPG